MSICCYYPTALISQKDIPRRFKVVLSWPSLCLAFFSDITSFTHRFFAVVGAERP